MKKFPLIGIQSNRKTGIQASKTDVCMLYACKDVCILLDNTFIVKCYLLRLI